MNTLNIAEKQKVESLIDSRILTEAEKQIVTCESCGDEYLRVDMPEDSPAICQSCRFSTYPWLG